MTDIPFDRTYDFRYGIIEPVAPGIRRLVARNPGPFTFHGTGTYIVGSGEVAVIDPGPDLPAHLDALMTGLRRERVTHILVTHTHRDHSPASRELKRRSGATVYAFGPHRTVPGDPGDPVEEGADRIFEPDIRVGHGDLIEGDGWSFECVHTPGHLSNHLCYQLKSGRALFCGDHVMAWSTTVISPPDGDMTEYLASLRSLLERDDETLWPTHGPPIREPKPFVRACLEHREARMQQVLDCLGRGPCQIEAMVPAIYHDLPAAMHAAAARSLFATVLHLHRLGAVSCDGAATITSRYSITE